MNNYFVNSLLYSSKSLNIQVIRFLLLFIICICTYNSCRSQDIAIQSNQGFVLVPIISLCKLCKASFHQYNKVYIIRKSAKVMKFRPFIDHIYADGRRQYITVPPIISRSITYIPLRQFSLFLQCKIEYYKINNNEFVNVHFAGDHVTYHISSYIRYLNTTQISQDSSAFTLVTDRCINI